MVKPDTYDAILAEVREMSPCTVRDLVEGVGLSDSTVRRALRDLEVQGLVESENYQRRASVWMAT